MKVLHVDKFLRRSGGGATCYMLDLGELQREAGHQVEFFAMADARNEPSTYQEQFAPHVRMEPPPQGAVAKAQAVVRSVWSPAARAAMEAVLDDFQPDIVHLHNIYHQLTPSVLQPLKALGIPAVMTVHDYKLVCPTYRFLDKRAPCTACLDGRFRHAMQKRCRDGRLGASAAMALEARIHRSLRAYGHVSRLLCPSLFLRDKLLEGGFASERLTHLPLFVEPQAPQAAGRGGVLFAGRLSFEKGVDVLLHAVGSLADERLTIAGDGPALADLQELAKRVAPGRVVFTGQLEKAGVLDLLHNARVAVLPARWYENQPLGVLEAMASGTPLVVTDMGGLPELVEDGRTGMVVPPEDPGALARALRHVSGETAARFGEAGRERAERDFAPGKHLRRVLRVYDDLLSARATS